LSREIFEVLNDEALYPDLINSQFGFNLAVLEIFNLLDINP